MLTKRVSLLHDSAHLLTANAYEVVWLANLNYIVYFFDLAIIDFHLFTFLNNQMCGKQFLTDEMVKQEDLKWTKEMV